MNLEINIELARDLVHIRTEYLKINNRVQDICDKYNTKNERGLIVDSGYHLILKTVGKLEDPKYSVEISKVLGDESYINLVRLRKKQEEYLLREKTIIEKMKNNSEKELNRIQIKKIIKDPILKLRREVLSCHKCTLRANMPTDKTPMCRGNIRGKIFILGEAPGNTEVDKGIPFCGEAGQLLDRALNRAGIPQNDIFITNSVQCHPTGNRNPTDLEVSLCMDFWKKMLIMMDPVIMIALGNIPLLALSGRTGITKIRGNIFHYHKYKVMPTFHPAYYLRGSREEILFKKQIGFQDFLKVRELVYG